MSLSPRLNSLQYSITNTYLYCYYVFLTSLKKVRTCKKVSTHLNPHQLGGLPGIYSIQPVSGIWLKNGANQHTIGFPPLRIIGFLSDASKCCSSILSTTGHYWCLCLLKMMKSLNNSNEIKRRNEIKYQYTKVSSKTGWKSKYIFKLWRTVFCHVHLCSRIPISQPET